MASDPSADATGTSNPPPEDSPASASGLKEGERKDAILAQFRARLARSRAHRAEWREEARALYDMAAGRQWDNADEAALAEQDRPAVTFNVAGKYLDAVQGLQINNRQEIRYAPREKGDLQVNEVLTGAVAWARDLTQMMDDETDAFYDCILTGEGWMEAYIDRDVEAAGVPCGVRVDPLEMFPDTDARRRNYGDGRFTIRLKQVDVGEYRELYGEDSDDGSTSTDLIGVEDLNEDDPIAHIVNQPQEYGQNRGASPVATSARRRMVADYQWVEREAAVYVTTEHPQIGARAFSAREWTALEPRFAAAQIPYKAEPFRRRTFYRAIIAGSKVHTWGLSPDQTGFTFKAITGKRDRNKRSFYGIGRAILDPQRWTNKFFSTILYAMMANAKGGLLAEENTFKDPKRAEAEWADPSSITWVKEGAIQKGKLQPKPAAPYPQGLDRLMQFSLEALPQTSGLNLEIMGMADRVQAGVVEAQRKQSAMSIIAWAFDAMRRYYYEMGRTLAEFVTKYVPEGTLVQVMGENGKQYVPLVRAQLQVPFDVIVDEAPSSVNQQERVWAVLQQLIPQLLQAGLKIPKEVLDFAPLPSELQLAWKQVLTPDPKEQQIDATKVQEMLRGLAAENAQKESAARLNVAKAEEIEANLAKPGEDPAAQMRMELFKTQVESQVDARIAEFKANKDAETKLLVEQMKIDSEERIAQMQAIIDARLESARIRADGQSRETVAMIGAAGKAHAAAQGGEAEDDKPDPTDTLAAVLADLKEVLAESGKKKGPRAFRIERDAMGEMARVVMDEGED